MGGGGGIAVCEKKDNLENFMHKEKNIKTFLMILEIIHSQKTCSRRNVKKKFLRQNKCNNRQKFGST